MARSPHSIATLMTPIRSSVATPSGCVHACRRRTPACPLASSPITITAIAALASGGETITLQVATIVAQRAMSIAREAGSASSVG